MGIGLDVHNPFSFGFYILQKPPTFYLHWNHMKIHQKYAHLKYVHQKETERNKKDPKEMN